MGIHLDFMAQPKQWKRPRCERCGLFCRGRWHLKCPRRQPHCKRCGQILGFANHRCASVDLKPERNCTDCGKLLSKQGYERWKNRCAYCEKVRWRAKERRLRKELKTRFGGRCSRCGYDRCFAALHFHHRNGRGEEPSGGTRIQEVRDHPERFKLVCANCHIEHHQDGGRL